MERFGEKLRLLREYHGLSLQQLGDILDVSKVHLWNLEHSKKTPNVAMVLKIADYFGVDVNQLIRDELEMNG